MEQAGGAEQDIEARGAGAHEPEGFQPAFQQHVGPAVLDMATSAAVMVRVDESGQNGHVVAAGDLGFGMCCAEIGEAADSGDLAVLDRYGAVVDHIAISIRDHPFAAHQNRHCDHSRVVGNKGNRKGCSRRDAETQRRRETREPESGLTRSRGGRGETRKQGNKETRKGITCWVLVPCRNSPSGFLVCYRAALRPRQCSPPSQELSTGAWFGNFCVIHSMVFPFLFLCASAPLRESSFLFSHLFLRVLRGSA